MTFKRQRAFLSVLHDVKGEKEVWTCMCRIRGLMQDEAPLHRLKAQGRERVLTRRGEALILILQEKKKKSIVCPLRSPSAGGSLRTLDIERRGMTTPPHQERS